MSYFLTRHLFDISCLEDLCEPSELIDGVEYRYNVDGELEFLGLAETDREWIDTDFYHCMSYGSQLRRIEAISAAKADNRRKRAERIAKAREKRKQNKLVASAEEVRQTHFKELTDAIGRIPTEFELGFFTVIPTEHGKALQYEIVFNEGPIRTTIRQQLPARRNLPVFGSLREFIIVMMRSITLQVVFVNQDTKQSSTETYSFAQADSVDAILKPTNLTPTAWGQLLLDAGDLYRVALMPHKEVFTKNFFYVSKDGLWAASGHFHRANDYVKHAIEFGDVRYVVPRTLP